MRTIVLAAAIAVAGSTAFAQTTGGQAGDENAVRQLPQKYQAAWNARDVQQVAALHTPDVLLVEPDGEVVKGRPALEANLRKNFQEMGNAKLSLDTETVRFVGPDTAVFTGKSSVTGGRMPGGADAGHFMVIARKTDGEWRASEVHLAVMPAAARPETAGTAGTTGTAGRSDAAAEAEVKEFENEWTKAMENRDYDTLDRIYADTYTFVDPTGKLMTREEDINDLKSGKLHFDSHEQSDVQTRIYGDTAVVTGISTIKGTYGGEDISGRYRWTDTLVRRDGEWKVAASQATRIVDEAPRK